MLGDAVVLPLLGLLSAVLPSVARVSAVGDDVHLSSPGGFGDEPPRRLVELQVPVRRSVEQTARETREARITAPMEKEAILVPSGRKRTLSTVV